MKKEKNLGGVCVALRKGEKVEIIVADVKILKFRRKFGRPGHQPELIIFKCIEREF